MHDGEHVVETPAARLRVRCAGQGSALVLIHGWALDLDMWTPQFDAFSERYRVIAFDRRGFGLSSGAPAIAHDVEDLFFLLDVLGVEQAALVGMSQGARVALRFALRAPHKTTCLTLDGAPHIVGPQRPPELDIDVYRALLAASGPEAVRQAWARHPLVQLHSDTPHACVLLQRMIARYPCADLRSPRSEALDAITYDELAQLRTPTLVINGALDTPVRRAAGAELRRTIPNATLAVIAGAGHLPNLDNPTAYNETLEGFLRRELDRSG